MSLDLFSSAPARRARDPGKLVASPQDLTAELIERLAGQSSRVLIKKLSTNDRQWAIWDEVRGKWKNNQAGPLLPEAARTGGFFPPLVPDPAKPHNSAVPVSVLWPVTGKLYISSFIWYSGKGSAENHFTTNPRSEFDTLSPASYLMIFRPQEPHEPYRALTIDAADDDLVSYITEVFGTGPDFRFGIFDARTVDLRPAMTGLQQFVIGLLACMDKGPAAFDAYVSSLTRPPASVIANAALQQWMHDTGHPDLNPYRLVNPGDVLHELTRVREFALYRQEEAKSYGAQIVRALIGDGRTVSRKDIVASLIERFEVFYDICKSAKQARSSRAGGSFEMHMSSVLDAGGIPHAPQNVFDGSKPDFVLPAAAVYADMDSRSTALVLTLKTTLRERWKQVVSETTGCPIFLATLDESVPGSTLEKLGRRNISLVVPEKFKTSEFAEYENCAGVLSYRDFFDRLLADWSGPWLAKRIRCFGITP